MARQGHRIQNKCSKFFNKFHEPSDVAAFLITLNFYMQMYIDYWYSYVSAGLKNNIHGHTRKDQRTYQRKFNSCLARRDRFKEKFPEYLLMKE